MEQALIAILDADASLVVLAGDQIYWGLAPQDVDGSFITLNVVSGVRDYALSGATGYAESRVQMDCWASTYPLAKALSNAAIAAVSAYRGEVASIHVGGVFVDNERDLNEARQGDIATRYRVSVDLRIHWRPNT